MNNDELVALAWQSRLLGPRLESWARLQPDKPCLRCDGAWLSWAEVELQTARIAAGLQQSGIGKGDRVALISKTCDDAVLSMLAVARLGGIIVPLNTFLRGEFLRFQLADAAAATVISDAPGIESLAAIGDQLPDLVSIFALDPVPAKLPSFQATVRLQAFAALKHSDANWSAPQLSQSDPMALIYTSGTTGLPKGCIYSHGYFMAAPIACIEGDWFRHDDVIFTPFPLFHTAGFSLMLGGALQTGASICFDGQFSASSFIQRAIDAGATVAHGVGPMGMAMLAAPESLLDRKHQLRLCTWPPMSPEHQERFERRFGVDVLCGGFGQTESVPLAMINAAQAKLKRKSLGRPANHMEVRVVDAHDQPVAVGEVGEIVARPRRADVMYLGYWRRPDATVEASRNLWHHTGDLGRVDEDGFLYYADRKKDSMRRRGENVSSYELERAILQYSAIAAVAAHAVPSDMAEDDIKVCLVLKPGQECSPPELFGFFKKTLPYFAIPRYAEFFDSLPTNASGRVMKDKLRARGIAEAWDFEALGLSVARDERRG